MVNSFLPSNWTDALAVAATAAEILLGIGLILGIYPRLVSLVRIFGAGVTPTELLWYPTTHTRDGSKRSGAPPVRGGLPARHGKTRCRLCGRLA